MENVSLENGRAGKDDDLDGDKGGPGEPVELAEELQVELTSLDEAVRVENEEEPEEDVQVERDVGHCHHRTSHLRESHYRFIVGHERVLPGSESSKGRICQDFQGFF